jgi:hypothetical protein
MVRLRWIARRRCPAIAIVDEDGDNVDDDDDEMERVPFLLQCVLFATFVDNFAMQMTR